MCSTSSSGGAQRPQGRRIWRADPSRPAEDVFTGSAVAVAGLGAERWTSSLGIMEFPLPSRRALPSHVLSPPTRWLYLVQAFCATGADFLSNSLGIITTPQRWGGAGIGATRLFCVWHNSASDGLGAPLPAARFRRPLAGGAVIPRPQELGGGAMRPCVMLPKGWSSAADTRGPPARRSARWEMRPPPRSMASISKISARIRQKLSRPCAVSSPKSSAWWWRARQVSACGVCAKNPSSDRLPPEARRKESRAPQHVGARPARYPTQLLVRPELHPQMAARAPKLRPGQRPPPG